MFRTATPGGAVADRASHRPSGASRGPRLRKSRFLGALLPASLAMACAAPDVMTVVTTTEETQPLPANAEIVLVSGDDQEGEVGAYLPNPLVVEVTDGAGGVVAGAEVTWTFVHGSGRQGQGQPSATVRVLTDQAGRASTEWLLGTTAGPQQAFADLPAPAPTAPSADGPSSAPGHGRHAGIGARGRPARADAMTVSPTTASISLGDSIQLDAAVADRYGNVLDGASVTWSSDDDGVVSTSPSGMAHGMGGGSAMVRAAYAQVEGTASLTVSGGVGNAAPTASIVSPSQNVSITLGDAVDFRGSANDADGSVVAHQWTFGDGNTASVEDPGSYTYASTGTFSVTYRVTDDQGAQSSTATRTVTVDDVAPPPPPPPPPGGGQEVFSSDWSSGEYTDGGKWEGESMWVNNNSMSVTNGVLELNATDDLDSWLQIRSVTNGVASPAVGETISWTWRMLVTQEGTQVADELTHGVGWGSMAVPNSFAVMYFYTRNGQWRPEIYVADPGGARPFGWSRDYPSAWNKALEADVWYDFTVSFQRLGSSSWRPTIEVRETDGTLIAGTADFYDWPMRGAANAVSLSTATISNGNARNAVEMVGFLNGLADHNYAVTWGEVDFVRAEMR